MPLAWNKTEDAISHHASADATGVTCSESSDDPHGVNSETRCSKEAWRSRDADGERCRRIILGTFGEDAVLQIDASFSS
jgi:hypothetical protein